MLPTLKRCSLCLAMALLLLCLGLSNPVLAQSPGRDIRLSVFLDYARAQSGERGGLIFDGTVNPPGAQPDLRGLGFMDDPPGELLTDEARGGVRGSIRSASLTFPQQDGWYHLYLGPLELAPEDTLTLILPFVNLDYTRIKPVPANLSGLLTQAARPPPNAPALFELRFSGTSLQDTALDIPFTPIQKKISLVITPLVGEMLFMPSPGFRLSGQVTFDQVRDYGEYLWDCPTDLAMQVDRYNVAHLLFGLDSPPALFPAAMLPAFYQSKATYTFVRMDPARCSFDAQKGGQVEAAFNGQVYRQATSGFPARWGDTRESNQANEFNPREYILEMGDIVLAPGDVLTIHMPEVAIHEIDPPPTRVNSTRGAPQEIVYEGPLYARLRLVYEPEAGLILGQLHNAARVETRPVEQLFGQAWGGNPGTFPPGAHLAAWAGLLAGVLFGVRTRLQQGKPGFWVEVCAWTLAALALFYGLRSIYGIFVLAVLVYLRAGTARQHSLGYFGRGAAAIVLILGAMLLDQLAAGQLFQVLRALELEITPLTALILFILGLGLVALLGIPAAQLAPLFPDAVLALALGLLPFTVLDAIQKSLVSLAILGLGAAYLFTRLQKRDGQMEYGVVAARFKQAWSNRLIPIGLVLLVLFGAQNGLQSTSAVLGALPAILRALLPPFLLLVSILTNFLANGLLFILLYPILPFRSSYLKAAAFGLFLLLIFLFGIGADENLVSTWQTLITGRIVYYAGAPLLIGLFFEIRPARDKSGSDAESPALEPQQTATLVSERLKDLRTLLSTLGSLATLVAPGVYAYFAHAPLLMNYFDLLETLLRVSTAR